MRDKVSQNTKCSRILFYWDELGRHGINPEVSLTYMEYVFSVRRTWILRIIKGYVRYKRVELAHPELETSNIDAFVQKLFKTAQHERFEKRRELIKHNKLI